MSGRRARLKPGLPVLAAAGIALFTTGCSGLRSHASPEQVYLLRLDAAPGGSAGAADVATSAPLPESLRVEVPDAAPGLYTDHVLLLRPDRRLEYYAASRWSAPIPELVGALAVGVLRAHGDWRSVEDASSHVETPWGLQLRVLRFETENGAGGLPMAHVNLHGTLNRNAALAGSFEVGAQAAASANSMSAVTEAFESASRQALDQLAVQVAAAARDLATRRQAASAEPPHPPHPAAPGGPQLPP